MPLAMLLYVAAALLLAALCVRRCVAQASLSREALFCSTLCSRRAPQPARARRKRRLLTWRARRLGAVLLSALLLRQARRAGLTLHVASVGYLSAADVTITAAKARVAPGVHARRAARRVRRRAAAQAAFQFQSPSAGRVSAALTRRRARRARCGA